MSQRSKVGEVDKEEQILRKLRHIESDLREEIAQIKKNQAQLRKDMGELKNQAGYSQPSEKLKVVTREVDANGDLQKLPANETIKAIHQQLKNRGGLETDKVEGILEDQGWGMSRRGVLDKMERMAEVWDWIELERRSERKEANCNRLKDTRQIK